MSENPQQSKHGSPVDHVTESLRLLFAGASPELQRLLWQVCGRRGRWLPKGRPSEVGLPDPHDGIGYDPLRGPVVADDSPSDDMMEGRQ
jgi:hypothetical protein